MKSTFEAPERRGGIAGTPRRGGAFKKVAAGVLAGALLAGSFFLGVSRSSGGTVVPAPVIQASGQSRALDAAAIYKADAPGTVLVESQVSGGQGLFGSTGQQGTALGSGFVVDGQGRIFTNYHVVDGASKVRVTLNNEKVYDARIVGSDPSNDLAILKIDAPADELTPLPMGDSSKLQVGQPVVAIGNPLGYNSTESQGIVSALGRDIQAPNGFTIMGAVQTDAPLTNGNSGGPLIDANGRVIGINSQVAANPTGTAQADGIGFAVPINAARDALRQLDDTGRITHPYLGISGVGITPDLANLFPVDRGVALADVAPGGPAEKAGLRGGDRAVDVGGKRVPVGGDVILAVDGRPVSDMGDLQGAISGNGVGQTVTLKVRRDSRTTDVQVNLDDRPPAVRG